MMLMDPEMTPMRDVLELLDALDLVVTRGTGVVPKARLAQAETIVGRIRDRRGFHGETLVLGLIGGTGSGKSSLLNAIAGERLASVSALRPHTDRPLAWLPENSAPSLLELLDNAGIIDRHVQSIYPDIALLDLPDIDSVAVNHRRSVEELLPEMDGVLWLLDPDKYRDTALHRDFLAPLARYREQFAFVLNKIDLIPPDDRKALVDDLRLALERDGYDDPDILVTAADPPAGERIGMDEVASYLSDRLDAKRMLRSKVIGDARTILRYLADAADVWTGWSMGFDEIWARDRHAAALGLLPMRGHRRSRRRIVQAGGPHRDGCVWRRRAVRIASAHRSRPRRARDRGCAGVEGGRREDAKGAETTRHRSARGGDRRGRGCTR